MTEPTIIDLDAVTLAAAQLAAWWDYFSTTGDPALPQLDQARRALTLLPPLPGPLGHAVRLVASDGTQATSTQIQAAIERITRFGNRRHTINPGAHVLRAVGPVEQLSFPLGDDHPDNVGQPIDNSSP